MSCPMQWHRQDFPREGGKGKGKGKDKGKGKVQPRIGHEGPEGE